jgi:hypothetical protein
VSPQARAPAYFDRATKLAQRKAVPGKATIDTRQHRHSFSDQIRQAQLDRAMAKHKLAASGFGASRARSS